MRSKTIFAVAILFGLARSAFALKPISINVVSNLQFGIGVQGDGSIIVIPSTSETADNASFAVAGHNNTAYSIVLPSSAALTTGAGGANETIAVNNFSSYPAQGANGLLNSTGSQNLFVGATRGTLLTNQATGSYTGTFTITVVY